MNSDDIKSMLAGIGDTTLDIIGRRLRSKLSIAISSVNSRLKTANLTHEDMSPSPDMIMNAFRLCDVDRVKVVILGQDPYIKPGEAHGLSFSIPRGVRIPPSLRNIYKCLKHQELIAEEPTHGDLTGWANQGVLLLNCALTTMIGKSNAHADCWTEYTNALIHELSAIPNIIFILLGTFAHTKRTQCAQAHVFEWGHPSPLNRANQSDNPKNFKFCDVFTKTNDLLISRGEPLINWDPDGEPREPIRLAANVLETYVVPVVAAVDENEPKIPPGGKMLWVFTDGGSKGNGNRECTATWGFYVTDGITCARWRGAVEPVDIPGEVFKTSNNRGELTAILRVLSFITTHRGEFVFPSVCVVSDSRYSINCLTVWAPNWFENPHDHRLSEKKNIDLIAEGVDLLNTLRKDFRVEFRHVNSHRKEPKDRCSEEWFLWKGNDIADKLC